METLTTPFRNSPNLTHHQELELAFPTRLSFELLFRASLLSFCLSSMKTSLGGREGVISHPREQTGMLPRRISRQTLDCGNIVLKVFACFSDPLFPSTILLQLSLPCHTLACKPPPWMRLYPLRPLTIAPSMPTQCRSSRKVASCLNPRKGNRSATSRLYHVKSA
jgi:hypothetical protein